VDRVGPPGVEPEVGRERGVGGLHLHHVQSLAPHIAQCRVSPENNGCEDRQKGNFGK
jgi:hypothetical protein